MKLVLFVALCIIGTVWGETHNQQKDFANYLIQDIEDAARYVKEMLQRYDETAENDKNLILLHANSFNFDLHFILDCLQYVVVNYQDQPRALQNVVLKLNEITNDLEKSFRSGANMVKRELAACVEDVVVEAKHLRQIVRENRLLSYTSTVVRFLDNMVSATQKLVVRDSLHNKPKNVIKSYLQVGKNTLISTLATMNSTNVNVYKDVFRYSTKLSSAMSETKTLIRDLTFTYNSNNEAEVKRIIYNLSKMVRENDEVLYRDSTFSRVKEQFRVTLESLAEQLYKVVDLGYSDNVTMEDENMIYIVIPDILNQGYQLQRNFEKTIRYYIRPRSNDN